MFGNRCDCVILKSIDTFFGNIESFINANQFVLERNFVNLGIMPFEFDTTGSEPFDESLTPMIL